jgi:hypothetical protein
MAPDERQYGTRTSEEIRGLLLRLLLEFVRAVREIRGVERLAVLGSLLTDRPRPKDADVLVSITEDIDFSTLARVGRRFKGKAQGINAGADVFLADRTGVYIGRVCHYRDCHPRLLCRARHCGARPHLRDDLDVVTLSAELIAVPPVVLYPVVAVNVPVPSDVTTLLLAPLRTDVKLASEAGSGT